MAQVPIKLSKFDNQPWGFRIQGGKDFSVPITVQKVISKLKQHVFLTLAYNLRGIETGIWTSLVFFQGEDEYMHTTFNMTLVVIVCQDLNNNRIRFSFQHCSNVMVAVATVTIIS